MKKAMMPIRTRISNASIITKVIIIIIGLPLGSPQLAHWIRLVELNPPSQQAVVGGKQSQLGIQLTLVIQLQFGTQLQFCGAFGTQLQFCREFGTQLQFCGAFGTQLQFCGEFSTQLQFCREFGTQLQTLAGLPTSGAGIGAKKQKIKPGQYVPWQYDPPLVCYRKISSNTILL